MNNEIKETRRPERTPTSHIQNQSQNNSECEECGGRGRRESGQPFPPAFFKKDINVMNDFEEMIREHKIN